MELADAVNVLGNFCGMRDLRALTPPALEDQYNIRQADAMVLFGGAILAGGDILAQAIRQGMAKKYIIVGGAGHTTPVLRQKMHALFPDLQTDAMPEAALFNCYLQRKYGLSADYLETESTNCGNNITFLLALMERQKIACGSVILCQDSTMQRRMGAVLRRYRPDMTIIHYAAYQAEVVETENGLQYAAQINGMWELSRYIELLLGEISRLTDDENGYGPKGKGYIVHVDIPEDVRSAFRTLSARYAVRQADPRFASEQRGL
ncbi:MAG: YdcF family protein [Clostridia bacterium]|nr:YdcF family protein [Clostridia bacterium]